MTDEAKAKPQSIWSQWWGRLQDDRPGRAELRRCGTVAEAAFVAPYHLLRRMKGNPTSERDLKHLGLIAAVLAHVEEDSHEPSAAALMAASDGDKPIVSDSRFRQILRADDQDLDDLLRELVRVLAQIKGRAPVHRLGEDLWWWNEKTRRDWALDYYERAMPEKSSKES